PDRQARLRAANFPRFAWPRLLRQRGTSAGQSGSAALARSDALRAVVRRSLKSRVPRRAEAVARQEASGCVAAIVVDGGGVLEGRGEVVLDARCYPSDDVAWFGGGERFEAEDVADESEPAELGCDEVRADVGSVGAELREQRPEQSRTQEVRQKVGGAWLG